MTVLFCLLTGCSEPEPIVTYTVPTKIPEQLLPPKDRMLATIVPLGEKVWFFKVTGPETAIESIESDFRDFVTTIKFDGGNPNLKDLPENWRRGGEKAMRYASIDVETPTKQLDISVSNLTRPPNSTADGDDDDAAKEAWNRYVQLNVNRWRGQLGLQNSDDDWAGGESITIDSSEGDPVWVDLLGEAADNSSMSPPFAGRMGSPRGMPPASPQASTQPGSTKGSSKSKLKFDRPDGWRDGKMSSMRMAAFSVGPEDAAAEVTVIAAGGDLRGNVARWIGQVQGGAPEDEVVDAALEAAEKITVSGRDAQRFVLTGKDTTKGDAIDATIVPMDEGFNMFIKMTGPVATVTEQNEALATFLDSLKF